jgi:hypothetical protein
MFGACRFLLIEARAGRQFMPARNYGMESFFWEDQIRERGARDAMIETKITLAEAIVVPVLTAVASRHSTVAAMDLEAVI